MKIKTLLSALGMATLALQVFTFSATEAVARKAKKAADPLVKMLREDLKLNPDLAANDANAKAYVENFNKRAASAAFKADDAELADLRKDHELLEKEVFAKLKNMPKYKALIAKHRLALLVLPKKVKKNKKESLTAGMETVKKIYFPATPEALEDKKDAPKPEEKK